MRIQINKEDRKRIEERMSKAEWEPDTIHYNKPVCGAYIRKIVIPLSFKIHGLNFLYQIKRECMLCSVETFSSYMVTRLLWRKLINKHFYDGLETEDMFYHLKGEICLPCLDTLHLKYYDRSLGISDFTKCPVNEPLTTLQATTKQNLPILKLPSNNFTNIRKRVDRCLKLNDTVAYVNYPSLNDYLLFTYTGDYNFKVIKDDSRRYFYVGQIIKLNTLIERLNLTKLDITACESPEFIWEFF